MKTKICQVCRSPLVIEAGQENEEREVNILKMSCLTCKRAFIAIIKAQEKVTI